MVSSVLSLIPALLDGAATTLALCSLAGCLACLLALPLVALRLSGSRVLAGLAAGYIALARGLPLLIVLFLIYFGLPSLIGARIPAFAGGVVALGLNGAAFMAEVLRGALTRIDRGQFDAARALGLPRWLTWVRIVAPQMVPIAAPAFVGELAFLVKASPLVSLITVVEITRRAQQIAQQTFDPLTPLLAAGLLYFMIIGTLSLGARHLERRSVAWVH